MFFGALRFTDCLSQVAPLPRTADSAIGFATVADALASLRADSKIQISVRRGWTVAYDKESRTHWSFAPRHDSSYPSVVKRTIQEGDDRFSVNVAVLCEASKSACDQLVAPRDPSASDVVKKATGEFVASLTPSERKEFLDASRDDLALFHFGAGSQVRERYFSSPDSVVRQAFCSNDPEAYCDIDSASMVIVVKAWELIRAEGG